MNPSKFKIVDIDATVMGTRYQHAILIYKPKEQVPAYPAVWLSEQGGYKTGVEYAKILQRFCNYLTEGPFSSDEGMLLSFWLYITVDAIKTWKTYRIEKKYRERKVSPALETIDREAGIVCNFLDWVTFDKGVNTLWDGKRKTVIRARAIHNDFLRGIAGPQEREVVDINTRVTIFPDSKHYPVEGLARKRQSKPHAYLSDQHMPILLEAFSDEVYTYATNYILRVMEARRERERDKYIEDHSLRHDLADQMGHSDIDTTFSRYVDNAIVIIKNCEAGKASYAFPNLEELLKGKHR